MTIPASVKFNVCDWNQRYALTTDPGDRSLADGTDGIAPNAQINGAVYIEDDRIAIAALGESLRGTHSSSSWVLMNGATIPSTYTFEFDIELTGDLPAQASDQSCRLFVGVFDIQGVSVGLLFSKQGIAIASDPDDPRPSLLGGSHALVFGTGDTAKNLTIRVLVNGTSRRVAIYANETGLAYNSSTGSGWYDIADLNLKYNVAALSGTSRYGDAIVVYARSALDKADVVASIASLRVSSSLVYPEDRPTAVIVAPPFASTSSVVSFSGTDSYDTTIRPLTYEWDILDRPTGSAAVLTGYAHASVVIGAVATDNEFMVTSRSTSSDDNEWSIVIVDPDVNSSPLTLALSVTDKTVTISLETDGTGALISTTRDVVDAFGITMAGGYSSEVDSLFLASVVDENAANAGVPPTGTFALTGGAGSTLPAPSLVTDIGGSYTIRLRVHNGVRYSASITHVLLVQATDQLVRHRPNSEYIFKYLPDFWKLVGDRNVMAEVWSAMTQALSNDLLALWQHDFSKSLRDLSRRFQRRWLDYEFHVTVPSAVTTTLVMPSSPASWQALVTPVTSGERASEATITHSSSTSPVGTGLALVRAPYFAPTVVNVVSSRKSGTTWVLRASEASFPSVQVVQEWSGGQWVHDPSAPVTVPQTSTHFSDGSHTTDVVPGTDLVRLYPGDVRTNGSLFSVTSKLTNHTLVLSITPQVITGITEWWDHVRPVGSIYVDAIPYLTLSDDFDVSATDIGLGDYIEADAVDPVSGETVSVSIPVVAVHGQNIFVDWYALFDVIDTMVALANPTQNIRASALATGYHSIPSLELRVTALCRHARSDSKDNLVSVPVAGTTTISSELTERLDYEVADEAVELRHLVSGNVTVTAGSRYVIFEQLASKHRDAVSVTDTTALTALGGRSLVLHTGDAGSYAIQEFDGRKVKLDRAPRFSGTSAAHIPKYSYASAGPDRLWAELSLFDNWKTIENNFGLLVGLPKASFDAFGAENADYLETVRAMVFAFTSGPSLGNIKAAVQTMFGMPIAEASGQITDWLEPTDEHDGKIVILYDEFSDVRVYTYPFGVSIALNPRTGNAYAPFTPVNFAGLFPDDADRSFLRWRERCLDAGYPEESLTREYFDTQFVLWLDSRVEANETLVDVVTVADYISDPDLVDSILTGQEMLRKYHTFVVQVPLDILGSGGVTGIVREFLDKAKPAHTNFILYGTVTRSDDISVVTHERLNPTIIIVDTIHTSPMTSPGGVGVPPVLPASLALRYPVEETLNRLPGIAGAWNADDVIDKYESSYACGMLDDYSGDGSFNERQRETHVVNALDSDVDVSRTRVWVPVQKRTGGAQADVEFLVGESVTVTDGGAVIPSMWDASPPTVYHISVGEHIKVPFGVYSPQVTHPYMYLVLEFEAAAGVNNYGHEDRLRELRANIAAVASPTITGLTSGAEADVLLGETSEFDGLDPMHYWEVEYIYKFNKLAEVAPEDTVQITTTQYISHLGMYVDVFEAANPGFDAASGFNIHRQVQQYPYDPLVAADDQYVPSIGPGIFTEHDLTAAVPDFGPPVPPATKATYRVRWGYQDQGKQTLVGAPVTDFVPDPSTDPLRNVHIGFAVKNHTYRQYTHGFALFRIPAAHLYRCSYNDMLGTVRLEGVFFQDDDPTRTNVPDFVDPSTYDGTRPGAWIYFIDEATGIGYPVTSFTFETGFAAGVGLRTVLGFDGFTQTSTGHIYMAPVPGGLPFGVFTIRVRSFRPYQMKAGGPFVVYYEDTDLVGAYTEWAPPAPGVFGASYGEGLLGVDGFGSD